MSVRTPRWIERRWLFRLSLHFYRWGFHVKTRRGESWRHFAVKASRSAVYGRSKGRRCLWIGWWRNVKGVRGKLGGWRLLLIADRLPERPRPDVSGAERGAIPFYPQAPRDREAPFEVL